MDFDSEAQAKKALTILGIPYVNYQYVTIYKKRLKDFVDRVNSNYGFRIKTFNYQIAKGKAKKHEYPELEKTYSLIKELALKYPYNSKISNEYKMKLQNCIDSWNDILKKHEPKKKKARINDRIAGAINMNIAIAYLMMKNWDQVFISCEKAKTFKTEKNSSSRLLNEVMDLKRRHNNAENYLGDQDMD